MRQVLTDKARSLRSEETPAEHALWKKLRNRQIDGWKFKRQVPHGRYILDFFCFDANLVIEVDGSQHYEEKLAYDRRRTRELDKDNLTVLRFWNADVLKNMDGVLEAIYLALGQRQAPSPGAERKHRASSPAVAAPASPQGERRFPNTTDDKT